MPELAIILPTLNERDNLAPLIDRIAAALGDIAWEAIIVDDDSTDGTADEARRLARADPRIRILHRIGRQGLASAAIEGMCATAAPYVALMDADHQHDPAMLPHMLDRVRSGQADIAVGSRFMDGAAADGLANQDRLAASGWANRIARRITGMDLTDPMSGFFVMETDRLRVLAPKLSGIGFKLLLDILAASSTLKVAELPLTFGERRSGQSKLDRVIAFEFLTGLYDRFFGQIIPTRFALFGTVGAVGVVVHMSVLALLFRLLGSDFLWASIGATFAAMSFNFWLNNALTYRDQRLIGFASMAKGWLGFCVTCSIGAFANVAAATVLEARGVYWLLAALVGIIIGAVWNYALSSRFVWGRY
ncbi:glycosyltransferase family 2 protein [Altererythrobacter sp. RZ02]|uniref:Glycosyltransferase family 2 protein n=1 Tax=Pontixanthobacter rizhaonensis TaxID=2730337 RepID=A0A848QGR5_9SPHN|nr:glycosyltransferase family 2 protein [Pontixanthobacter rizhaonensis]NMW31802.1 glycosyltransferase family 2 protein [Pontixanthobacter rizhaonensis]